MRKLYLLLLLSIFTVSASAQSDWRAILGAEFDVYFDNREYVDMKFGESQTIFGSRLTPYVGVGWNQKHSLMLGVDLRTNFGNRTTTFERVLPQVYYQFKNEKVTTAFGTFSRKKLVGDYSEAIMSDSMKFQDNRIQGLLAQYRGERGDFEISVDWCGMFSDQSREKFRILSYGKYYFDKTNKHFFGGYQFMMFHFAGSKLIQHCVNDNLLIEPYIGTQFNAWADFDIQLHYLQTAQRDRDNDTKYRTPKGGLLKFRMSKLGIFLSEDLYFGQNLQPYYRSYRSEDFPNGYGCELYSGDSFFGTNKNFYSATKVGYERKFLSDVMHVKAYISFRHDGTGFGTNQVVSLSINLLKDISLQKKK